LVCGVFGVCWLWALGRGGGRRAEALLLFHLLLLFIAVRLLQWPTLVVTHLVGWVCLLLLPLAPFAPPSHRLLALFLALAAPVAFLSFGHEALFLPPLVLALTFTRKFELEADAGDSKRFWSLELELGAQNTLTPLPTAFRRAAFHVSHPHTHTYPAHLYESSSFVSCVSCSSGACPSSDCVMPRVQCPS
jgi:hypothetical protein